jgi:hypothetical protein
MLSFYTPHLSLHASASGCDQDTLSLDDVVTVALVCVQLPCITALGPLPKYHRDVPSRPPSPRRILSVMVSAHVSHYGTHRIAGVWMASVSLTTFQCGIILFRANSRTKLCPPSESPFACLMLPSRSRDTDLIARKIALWLLPTLPCHRVVLYCIWATIASHLIIQSCSYPLIRDTCRVLGRGPLQGGKSAIGTVLWRLPTKSCHGTSSVCASIILPPEYDFKSSGSLPSHCMC